jgi:hypothetical protein
MLVSPKPMQSDRDGFINQRLRWMNCDLRFHLLVSRIAHRQVLLKRILDSLEVTPHAPREGRRAFCGVLLEAVDTQPGLLCCELQR